MIPLSVEVKLVTIVLMALLNIFLLKRKRTNEQVESYSVDGSGQTGLTDRNQNDGRFKEKYVQKDTFFDCSDQAVSKNFPNSKDIHQNQQQFFVRQIQNNILQNFSEPKKQTESLFEVNPKELLNTPFIQEVKLLQSPKLIQKSPVDAPFHHLKNSPAQNSKIQISNLSIPMQQESHLEEFQDIKEVHSDEQEKQFDTPKLKTKGHVLLLSQRKYYTNSKSESQSDSNSKKTIINLPSKEKLSCKSLCPNCKNQQTPRETLKRGLQDLIYATFEQMIQKTHLQHKTGSKKKKRSM